MSVHPGHYRKECRFGTVVTQCRCPGDKAVIVVDCPPNHRHEEAATPTSAPRSKPDSARDERRRVVAFLRRKAHDLGPTTSPTSSLALVQATLLDAAAWVENGDHA